ncbi:MAG: hypothetical protein V3T49_02370 [Dehalococcoidia bacterium]
MNDNNVRDADRPPGFTPGGHTTAFFKITVGPDSEPVPTGSSDKLTVYYGVLLANVKFTNEVGEQSLTYDTTTKSDFIMSLSYGESLEAGDIVVCFRKNARWWTTPGDAVSCKPQNTIIDFTMMGTPTGGTWDLRDFSVNSVPFLLTFDYDVDAAGMKTEFETHPQIEVDDVRVSIGSFPDTPIRVEFINNLAYQAFLLPTPDPANLTGDIVKAVIPQTIQRGGS